MEKKNWQMITCMDEYGGSFVKSLAGCLTHADPINYQILKRAFPEYFKEYGDMAREREKNA